MTKEEMEGLVIGDVIRHASGSAYVVIEACGKQVIAVRSIFVSNPHEWGAIQSAQ